VCDLVLFTHLPCGLEPRNLNRQLLVPSPRQKNRPKRALTSICMEVTYNCHLLGLFLLLALANFLLTCSGRASVTATPCCVSLAKDSFICYTHWEYWWHNWRMRRKFSKRGRNDPTTGRSAVTFKFGDESSFSKRDIVKILPFPGPSPAGGPVVPGPPIRNRCPSISRLAPPVAACIQYFMLKMWTSLLVFGPPWLLNPGDGPASFQKSLEQRKDEKHVFSSDFKNQINILKWK